MEKQILSDKEIESILQFNRSRKDGIRVVDLYHALHEEFGLYEAEKSILSIMDKSITLTEHEKKRAMLEERTSMTTGDVEYNPTVISLSTEFILIFTDEKEQKRRLSGAFWAETQLVLRRFGKKNYRICSYAGVY